MRCGLFQLRPSAAASAALLHRVFGCPVVALDQMRRDAIGSPFVGRIAFRDRLAKNLYLGVRIDCAAICGVPAPLQQPRSRILYKSDLYAIGLASSSPSLCAVGMRRKVK
jgi:hypothetical protein